MWENFKFHFKKLSLFFLSGEILSSCAQGYPCLCSKVKPDDIGELYVVQGSREVQGK